MDLQLGGRTVVVRGGSSSVGLATVETLLGEGANVVTCGRDAERLRQLHVAGVVPARLVTRVAHVTDPAQSIGVVDSAVQAFGRLDALLANAGEGSTRSVIHSPYDDWTRQFDTKVGSVLHVVRAAIPDLIASDAGRVVVVAVTSHAPDPAMPAVSAARAAVASASELLARELAPHGVCVYVVSLGPIRTDRQRARFEQSGTLLDYDEWCRQQAAERGVPLGRFGAPEEVAPWVAALVSPLASYVTGATLDLAGGLGARP